MARVWKIARKTFVKFFMKYNKIVTVYALLFRYRKIKFTWKVYSVVFSLFGFLKVSRNIIIITYINLIDINIILLLKYSKGATCNSIHIFYSRY